MTAPSANRGRPRKYSIEIYRQAAELHAQGGRTWREVAVSMGLPPAAINTLKRQARDCAVSVGGKGGESGVKGSDVAGWQPPTPSKNKPSPCDDREVQERSPLTPPPSQLDHSLRTVWDCLNNLKVELDHWRDRIGQLEQAVVEAALSSIPADAFDDIHVGQKGEKGDSAPEDGDLPI